MEQFCNFLLPVEKFDCLRSTGPGNTQPGALNVTWVMEHTSNPPRAVSTRTGVCPQDRVADVVVINQQKDFHTIVIEVKHDERANSAAHNIEQMVGLFHPNHCVMLGLRV